MLTDFEFFIATLPDWDGKDRVSELEKLVEVKTGIYMHKDYHFFVGRWVSLSIIKARDGDSGLIFLGKQGIGKSTLIRWLFPFRQEVALCEGGEIATANGTKIIEIETGAVSLSALTVLGLPILSIDHIDYSYTSIDIKQLYAQVLAEAKE